MANENLFKIKEITEKFLEMMDFDGVVKVDDSDENFLRINIETSEAGYLIGKEGETLKVLRQLIQTIVSRQLKEPVRYIIDVNDYQRGRLGILRQAAINLANEVVKRGLPRQLSPMNSYERRAVHMELAKIDGIKTESRGEGEERKIVILPN